MRTTQLDAAVLYATTKHFFFFGRHSRLFCISDFILKLVWECLSRWANPFSQKKHFFSFGRHSRLFCISDFILKLVWECLSRWANPFSTLIRVLNILFALFLDFRGIGLGFLHCAGRYQTGFFQFSSPLGRSCMHARISEPATRGSVPPGLRWLYVRGQTNQRLANGVGVSTPRGAVSIPENIVLFTRCWSCR